MRLDLFLKISRLVKRRAVAQELCEGGRVLVGGREAKPAKEVKPGDVITINYASRLVELEVLGVPPPGKKTASDAVYRITSDKRLSRENE